MTWTKMAEVPNPVFDTNGNPYSGAVLKAYVAGTTTAISIAIDKDGTSPQATITANADGIWEVSGNEIVPHIDRECKWGIFANSTDATANTPFYMGPFDNVAQSKSSDDSASFVTDVEYHLGSEFDGSNKITLTNSYTPGNDNLHVFLNGNRLRLGSGFDYTETSGTEVTLTYAPLANDNYTFVMGATQTTASPDAASVSYTPAGSGAQATNVQAKLRESVSVKDFGAVGDGVTDDYAAIRAAIDSLPHEGGAIHFPATPENTYRISQTIDIRKPVRLTGNVAFSGSTYIHGTRILVDDDVTGFIFNSYNTTLYTTDPSPDQSVNPGASGSIIEKLQIFSNGGVGSTADGIVLRCRMTVRDVYVRGFTRYGFRIVGDIGAGGDLEGDVNQWFLENVQALLCGNHGCYVAGPDANRGTMIRAFFQLNGGFGVYENSFLGNDYYGVDFAGNTSGPMHISGYSGTSVNATTAVGLWEDGGGASEFTSPIATIIGGNLGQPTDASLSYTMSGGQARNKPTSYVNQEGSEDIAAALGQNDTTLSAMTFGAASESAALNAWKFKFNPTDKEWYLQYANSTSFEPIHYLNSAATPYSDNGFTGPVFQNGYAVMNSGSVNNALVRKLGTAAPVSGTYKQGDIVYNSAPTGGGNIGWVCVSAGSPGTWKAFGTISA